MQIKKPPIRTLSNLFFGNHTLLYFLESLTEPLVMLLVIWCIFIDAENTIPLPIFVTSILVFMLTFPSGNKIRKDFFSMGKAILIEWFSIAFILLILAFATKFIFTLSTAIIVKCLAITPICQIIALQILKWLSPSITALRTTNLNTLIIGVNQQGLLLADTLKQNYYQPTTLLGFFEDRSFERLPIDNPYPVLGDLSEIAIYLKRQNVHTIYICLPMSSHPRIVKLLGEIKNSTASIYFVPDIFVTDLIPGKLSDINGLPLVSVCDSPFTVLDSFMKRLADIIFSIIILILISPIFAFVALGVKLSSPGPIIFKQRRYGLNGQEILVYKFRSMTVTEDGNKITQATKNDNRTTIFGRYIRKNSLDELPQFINVLQGNMSVVGPRPHAVSHNEEYRKKITGYMTRHKVKPGITGWAQVNGFRGETISLEKMEQRVHYDLEYLRHWSFRLDMLIIVKTIWLLLKGQEGAY